MKRVQPVSCDLNCGICYQQYNLADKQPMIVCSNRHSICKYCMGEIQSLLCPFCRQIINLDHVTVNYTIQNLLPSHSPNLRGEIQNHRFNPLFSNNQLATYNRQNEGIIDQDFDQNNEEIETNCLQRLRVAISIQVQRPISYALLVQLPFIILDLIFTRLNNDPNCMDKQYDLPVTARQLFFVMGIAGVSITCAFVLIILLSSSRIINPCVIACLEYLIPFLLGTKFLFWMIAEPILFLDVIKVHCSGAFYAYCLIQAFIFALILLIVAFCNFLRS